MLYEKVTLVLYKVCMLVTVPWCYSRMEGTHRAVSRHCQPPQMSDAVGEFLRVRSLESVTRFKSTLTGTLFADYLTMDRVVHL
jgi:hypothetical protein